MKDASLPQPSEAASRISGRRRWLLHLIVLTIMLVLAAGAILVADIYLHHKLAQYVAVNVWGYRGTVLGRKQPNEKRILMIGPSTVFSVGVPPEDALPAQLERLLQPRVPYPIHVVNVGLPGEDAFAYKADLEDFRFLKPDAVIFYGDSNPFGAALPLVLRRLSPVFRLTGYYPIIDTALREKAAAMLHGGDVNGAYGNDKVVFRPGMAGRAGAAALGGAADVAEQMHRVLGALTVTEEMPPVVVRTCDTEFTGLCDAINNAVTYARSLNLPTLVVNQPYKSDTQVRAQQAVQAMLRERHGNDGQVRYLDAGWAIDLKDPELCFDGEHLSKSGNLKMAEYLVDASLWLLGAPR
jgi:hypothetical protein